MMTLWFQQRRHVEKEECGSRQASLHHLHQRGGGSSCTRLAARAHRRPATSLTFCCLLTTSALTFGSRGAHGWGSFFSSSSSKPSPTPSIRPELLERAAEVRKTFSGKYAVMPPSANDADGYNEFFYPSSYIKQDRNEKLKLSDRLDDEDADSNNRLRGFCNWLIPNRIMIGQYPGQTPEKDGPIDEEIENKIKDFFKANN